MPITIESLPVELVVHIATYLDFPLICSLRLTSRTLVGKLSPENLPQFFAYKNVRLDHASLNDFVYMTCPGRAGCVLQHCTITIVADTSSVPDLTRLLTDAFVNLKRNSPRSGFLSLRVNVESQHELIFNDNGRSLRVLPQHSSHFKSKTHQALRIIWPTAQQIFETTLAALRESHLSVSHHFELLDAVRGCSLPYCDALLPITQLASATNVFSLLKRLTMSLCSNAYNQNICGTTLIRESVHGSSLLQGLLVMLASIPHLEELDIHWYIVSKLDPSSLEDDTMDLAVAAPLEFPYLNLKACSLRGLYVAGEDLLRYIKAARPAKLTLADISLVSGAWTPIFEYLSSSTLPITSYHLDDLREGDGLLVHFDDVPGQSKFLYHGVQMGPSTLIRQMGETGATIRYQCTTRRPLGSPTRMRWLKNKKLEFGPPCFLQ